MLPRAGSLRALPLAALIAAAAAGAPPTNCTQLTQPQCNDLVTGAAYACQYDTTRGVCETNICYGRGQAACVTAPTVTRDGAAYVQCQYVDGNCVPATWRFEVSLCSQTATDAASCPEDSVAAELCAWDGSACRFYDPQRCSEAATAARTVNNAPAHIANACAQEGVCDYHIAENTCAFAACEQVYAASLCNGGCVWDAATARCGPSPICGDSGVFMCAGGMRQGCGLDNDTCVSCSTLTTEASCDATHRCLWRGDCVAQASFDCGLLDDSTCRAAADCFVLSPGRCEEKKDAPTCFDFAEFECERQFGEACQWSAVESRCLLRETAACGSLTGAACRLRPDCRVQEIGAFTEVCETQPLGNRCHRVDDKPADCNAIADCAYVPRAQGTKDGDGTCLPVRFDVSPNTVCKDIKTAGTCDAQEICAWHAGHGVCGPAVCSALEPAACTASTSCTYSAGICHPREASPADTPCAVLDFSTVCDGGNCTGISSKIPAGSVATMVPSYTAATNVPYLPPFVTYLFEVNPLGGLPCTWEERVTGECNLCADGYIENPLVRLMCAPGAPGNLLADGQLCVPVDDICAMTWSCATDEGAKNTTAPATGVPVSTAIPRSVATSAPTTAVPGVPATQSPTTNAPIAATVGKSLLMLINTSLDLFNIMNFEMAVRSVVNALLVREVTVLFVCPASVCPAGTCPTSTQIKVQSGCRLGSAYRGVAATTTHRTAFVLQSNGATEVTSYVEFDVVPQDDVNVNAARSHAYNALLRDLETPSTSKMAASGLFPQRILTQDPPVGTAMPTPAPNTDSGDDYHTHFVVALVVGILILVLCILAIVYFKMKAVADEPESPAKGREDWAPPAAAQQQQQRTSQVSRQEGIPYTMSREGPPAYAEAPVRGQPTGVPPAVQQPQDMSWDRPDAPVAGRLGSQSAHPLQQLDHSPHQGSSFQKEDPTGFSTPGRSVNQDYMLPAAAASTAGAPGGASWQPGDIVEVLFDDQWFPAQVVEVQPDGNLTVNWDDGTHSRDVHPAFTRYPRSTPDA